MNNLKVLVIGGAGLIGSHVVEELIENKAVNEIIIFDNFTRGTQDNIAESLKSKKVRVFELGGDILHTDILNEAMKGVDVVFHLSALWLLHCHDFPRSAFHVNIEGTFNIRGMCEK